MIFEKRLKMAFFKISFASLHNPSHISFVLTCLKFLSQFLIVYVMFVYIIFCVKYIFLPTFFCLNYFRFFFHYRPTKFNLIHSTRLANLVATGGKAVIVVHFTRSVMKPFHRLITKAGNIRQLFR